MHEVDQLTLLIAEHCNGDGDSAALIKQRLYETRKRGTYLVRWNAAGEVVGYLDYDVSVDGIVHVRKLIALQPGLIWSMVSELKHLLPWKRVYFYRAHRGWRHHAKPWRLRHVVA